MQTIKVFVIMPFKAEFDDVYLVIKDACSDPSLAGRIYCHRGDDFEKAGRISDQIVDSIRAADALIVELTGNNPNVMYELGFAHALGKSALIINQSPPREAPFDITGYRQVQYDRSRLVKDLRQRLVSAMAALLNDNEGQQAGDVEVGDEAQPAASPIESTSPVRPSSEVAATLQNYHLRLRVAREAANRAEVNRLGSALIQLVDRISVIKGADPTDINNVSGMIANCGVELELAGNAQLAEDMFKRAIGVRPDGGGVHLQYADFLVDEGRLDEAIKEFETGKRLSPDDRRVKPLEVKMAMKSGGDQGNPDLEKRLRAEFESNPGKKQFAMAYLLYLQSSGASHERFEAVCLQWRKALPEKDRIMADRVLADYHAHVNNYDRAIAMYQGMLPQVPSSDRSHVLHNLATCLHIRDAEGDRPSALKFWEEAYALEPGSAAIRSAFSQALSIAGELDRALQVSSGQELSAERASSDGSVVEDASSD